MSNGLPQQLQDIQRRILALQHELPDSALQRELQRLQRDIQALGADGLPRLGGGIVEPLPPDVQLTGDALETWENLVAFHKQLLTYSGGGPHLPRTEWLSLVDAAADLVGGSGGGGTPSVLPNPPASGNPWAWNSDSGSWMLVRQPASGPIPPSGPMMGDTWYDTTASQLKVWNGVTWEAVAAELTLPMALSDGGTGATNATQAVINLGGPWVLPGDLTTTLTNYAPLNNPTNGQNNYAPLGSPNFTGIVTVNGTGLTDMFAPLSNPAAGQNNYAPLNNPSFTGTVTLSGPGTAALQAVTVQQLNDMAAALGAGTVTSLAAATGITLTPNPIVGTGTVGLTIPVLVTSGGTGAITGPLALDSLSSTTGATNGVLSRNPVGAWSVAPPLNDMVIPTPNVNNGTDVYYVLAEGGNDSNDGRSWRTGLATIREAANRVNAKVGQAWGGVINVGPGSHYIDTPDSKGNGVTLLRYAAQIRGAGRLTTNIFFRTGTYNWGIALAATACECRDLAIYVQNPAEILWGGIGATIETGADLTTTKGDWQTQTNTVGNASLCTFAHLNVMTDGLGGRCRFGYALGADTYGGGANINGTEFFDIHAHGTAPGYMDVCLLVGNGTNGNINDVYVHGFNFSTAKYCIVSIGMGIRCYGGQMGHASIADLGHAGGGDPFVVDGVRSEVSARLFISVNPGWASTTDEFQRANSPMWTADTAVGGTNTDAQVTLANIKWVTLSAYESLSRPGYCPVVEYHLAGNLRISNLNIWYVTKNDGATPLKPQIVLYNWASIGCVIDGITVSTPIDELVLRTGPTAAGREAISGTISGYVYCEQNAATYPMNPVTALPVPVSDLDGNFTFSGPNTPSRFRLTAVNNQLQLENVNWPMAAGGPYAWFNFPDSSTSPAPMGHTGLWLGQDLRCQGNGSFDGVLSAVGAIWGQHGLRLFGESGEPGLHTIGFSSGAGVTHGQQVGGIFRTTDGVFVLSSGGYLSPGPEIPPGSGNFTSIPRAGAPVVEELRMENGNLNYYAGTGLTVDTELTAANFPLVLQVRPNGGGVWYRNAGGTLVRIPGT